ncbi:MAG: cysteine protease [Prevotella sp.]|nr:cysteine protease [Prevotella sp.]
MHQKSKILIVLLLGSLTLFSCKKKESKEHTFTTDVINKITPIKDQKSSEACWIYAMLATIESEHLMMGDSVNLSAVFLARNYLSSQVERYYLTRGADSLSLRGIAPLTLHLMEKYGIMPYEAYHSDCNFDVVRKKLSLSLDEMIAERSGLITLKKRTLDLLDELINPVPFNVYMFGVKYTPKEFAHSVCLEKEYIAITSFTHKPFYENIILDILDNRYDEKMLNLPLDSMTMRVEKALLSHHSVCWEGDISEEGFSFEKGIATLGNSKKPLTQQERQKEFEDFSTTDDHCMEIIGLAHDEEGEKYFICKNSWGTSNPYRGLMYMSEAYFRLKTICVVVPNIFL